ncbi:MAG TPA: ATP-binding protein, partial [Candidatus Deferrimicrobiaceae bacterium]
MAFACLCFLGLIAARPAHALEKATVQLKWLHQFQLAGYQNPSRWRQIADTLADLGMMPRGIDVTPLVYDPEPRRNYRALVVAILAAGVIIAVLAGLLLALRRLNRRLSLAHDELKRSAEQLRVLFESSQAGILMVDPGGRVTVVNQRMGELFACRPESLVGTWYPDLVHPDDRDDATEKMGQILSAEIDRVGAERHYLRKDGTDFPGYISVRRHNDASGKLISLVCHISDISELKHAEEERARMDRQLLHAQKLESLGVLAGGIAHDFNNLLAGILGNLSLARKFLDPSHRASKNLLEAETASRRATGLALQLLTFAKGGDPVKKAVPAGPLIRESASLVLSGSKVKVEFDLPDSLPAIEVDEGQIGQVINNLVLNAAQSMPGGGTVAISAEALSLDGGGTVPLPPGRYVRFMVADSGCGIAPENLKRIFDPYFSTRSGGSGLGLASVWSIVAKHGGHIGVRSEVGIGTTIEVVLPANAGAAPDPSAADSASAGPRSASGRSLLVMDDETMLRTLVADMLQELGCRVATCGDGGEAIARYRAAFEAGTPFDAVIMDLTIPGGMGGKEAAQRILEIDPAARLVVSSGYSNDPVMAEFRKWGFGATMAKPYDMDEIER